MSHLIIVSENFFAQKIEKIVQKFLEMKKMHYSPRWEVVHLMYFYIL